MCGFRCRRNGPAKILRDVLLESGAEGELVPDADIAALAIEHGLAVCSTDADFARFPLARWINPLRKG
ncbi:MAG: hypothetical protein JO056_12630 [Alphaproteobacteria bacterium]|nr:hypothetical protein [Alphaproteobacteria bacterium]